MLALVHLESCYNAGILDQNEDTPVGLPPKVAKLGSFRFGRNTARDFRRVFKEPVD